MIPTGVRTTLAHMFFVVGLDSSRATQPWKWKMNRSGILACAMLCIRICLVVVDAKLLVLPGICFVAKAIAFPRDLVRYGPNWQNYDFSLGCGLSWRQKLERASLCAAAWPKKTCQTETVICLIGSGACPHPLQKRALCH